MSRVINGFDVSASTVRPSVTMYGYGVSTLNTLLDVSGEFVDVLTNDPLSGMMSHVKKQQIINRTLSASPQGGARRLGHALEHVCNEVLHMSRGSRSRVETRRPVPKVIVILSSGGSIDGIPRDLSCFNQPAYANQLDVSIIGLGLGKEGVNSLRHDMIGEIISLTVPEQLLTVDSNVIKMICERAIQTCHGRHFDLVFLLDG